MIFVCDSFDYSQGPIFTLGDIAVEVPALWSLPSCAGDKYYTKKKIIQGKGAREYRILLKQVSQL